MYFFVFKLIVIVLRVIYLCSGGDFDWFFDVVGGGWVDFFVGFCDFFEDGFVGEVGDDFGFLIFEGDFVVFDVCDG